MINIGKKNKWALVQCLREAFEKEIGKISLNEMMQHTFSREMPQYKMILTIEAEHVHRVVLEKELSDANKRIERLEEQIKKEEEKPGLPISPNVGKKLGAGHCWMCGKHEGDKRHNSKGVAYREMFCETCVGLLRNQGFDIVVEETKEPESNPETPCEICTGKWGSLVRYTESGVNRSAILCDDCVNKIASHSNVKIVSRW